MRKREELKFSDEFILDFLEFCIKERPSTVLEIIRKFGCPRHMSKGEVIKFLKILKLRRLIDFSLYANKFVLVFSPELMRYLKVLKSRSIEFFEVKKQISEHNDE